MHALVYYYDGSWYGLLSAIFRAFEYKEEPIAIRKERATETLFNDSRQITTDETKAIRLIKGINKKSALTLKRLYWAFLSEKDDCELLCLQVVRLVFKEKEQAESDYRKKQVLAIKQIEKEIGREIHRMHAFVRFQEAKDGIWYAFIRPDFNVLPLITEHFEKRYADQKWVIYDLSRSYGMFYDLHKVEQISISFEETVQDGLIPKETKSSSESDYIDLWKQYFVSATIKERLNMKLHIQHVPRRYWSLMPEINNT